MYFTKAELVILQLNRFGNIAFEELNMPYGMTQDGIATALCISRAHASIELKKILNKGLVDVYQAHVMHRPKKINVYLLTSDGRRRANDLVRRAKEEAIDINTLFTVRPMRKALNSTPIIMGVEAELKKSLEYIERIRQSKTPEDLYPIFLSLIEAQKLIFNKEVRE